jgi:hypothetical protein
MCIFFYHPHRLLSSIVQSNQKPKLIIRHYCNPSLGLATKAKGCKVAGQEGSPGVMLHALESAKECEGIDPHTPKGTPTLGVIVPMDS